MKSSERPVILKSKDSYELLIQNWDLNNIEVVEEFKILLLNQSNRVLGIYEVSKGGITGTVADPRLIFGVAVTSGAVAMIMAHSHPSGNLQPSVADKELTRKVKNAGDLLAIKVLDHIIVTSENYYSFADEGLL